jgi:hypothetical protein
MSIGQINGLPRIQALPIDTRLTSLGYTLAGWPIFQKRRNLKWNSEAGLRVAVTPRRRKLLATPSSPVGAASFPASEKM